MEKIIALRIKVADKREAVAAIKPVNAELAKGGQLLDTQIRKYGQLLKLQNQLKNGARSSGSGTSGGSTTTGSGSGTRSGASTNLDSATALRNQAIAAKDAGLNVEQLIARIAELKVKQKEVNLEVKEQTRLFEEAKFAAGSYRAINAEVGRLANSYRDSSKAERTGIAGQQTLARIKVLRTQLKNIDADMGIYFRNVGNYASAFDQVGGVVARFTALAGISLGAAEIVSEAGLISDAIGNVQKVSGLAQEQVRALSDDLRLRDTRTSLQDQLDIAEVGGRLGVNVSNLGIDEATRQLVEFTDSVDIANVALGDQFNNDAEQVASTLAGLRNVLVDFRPNGDGDIGGDILRLGNALNFLETQGNSTAPVIADLVNRIGAGAVPLDATTESIFALSTTLDEMQVTAELGATAITKTLTDLAAAPEDFAGIVVESGLIESSEAFTTLVNEDLITALTLVAQAAGDTTESNTEFAQTLEALGIDGTRAVGVFGKLSGATDRYNELLDISRDSLAGTSSLTDEFAVKNNTLQASVDKLRNQLVDTFTTGTVQDGLKTIIDGVGQFVTILVALPGFIRENRVGLLLLVAALLTFNGGLIASQALLLKQALATKAAAIGQRILNVAMRANPLGLVLTGILLLVGGLTLLYNNSETVRKAIDEFTDSLLEAYNNSALLRAALGPLGTAIKLAIGFFKEGPVVFADFYDSIKTMVSNIVPELEVLGLRFQKFALTTAKSFAFGGAARSIQKEITDVESAILSAQRVIEENNAARDQRAIDRRKQLLEAQAETRRLADVKAAAEKEEAEKGLTAAELQELENRRKARADALKKQREQEAADRLAAAKRILDLENDLIFNRFDRQERQAETETERTIAGLVGDPGQIERQAALVRAKLTLELKSINEARKAAQDEALALVRDYAVQLRDARIEAGTNSAQAEFDEVESFFDLQERALRAQFAQQSAQLLSAFRDGEVTYKEYTQRRAFLGKADKDASVKLAAERFAEESAADAMLTEQLLIQAQQRYDILKAQREADQAERDAALGTELAEGDIGVDDFGEGIDNSEETRRIQDLEDLRAFEEEKATISTDFAIRNLTRLEENAKAEGDIARGSNKELIRLEKDKQKIILESTEAIGESIGQFLTGQQGDFKDFLKSVLTIALDAVEKLILVSISSASAIALAQPDSVATFGASGLARAAILTGLIKGAFVGIKAAVNSFEYGGVLGEQNSGRWVGGTVPAGSGPITGRSHSAGGIRRGNDVVQGREYKIQNGNEHYIVNDRSASMFLPQLRALSSNPYVYSALRRRQVSDINTLGGGRSFADGGVLIGSQPLSAPVPRGLIGNNSDGGLSVDDAALLIESAQVGKVMAESAMSLAAEVNARIDRLQVLINPGEAVTAGNNQLRAESRTGL